MTIVYPSSNVTYIEYWPDGVELSLLCATVPHPATLSFRWFKDNVPLANSARWRYRNVSPTDVQSSFAQEMIIYIFIIFIIFIIYIFIYIFQLVS